MSVPINDPPEPAVMEAVTEEPVATVLLPESWKVRTGWIANAELDIPVVVETVLTIFVAEPADNVTVVVVEVSPLDA